VSSHSPFHTHNPTPKRAWTVEEAWQHGLNENFWRWGLVFNQGNDMNVSRERVKDRLNFILSRLLRKMYGNRFRDKAVARAIIFEHGASASFNRHYHALVGIEAKQVPWSDFRVRLAIAKLDSEFVRGSRSEKIVHVDSGWEKGNRYHSYVSRYVQNHNGRGDWFVLD
jgi:hypothetical protein